MVHSDPIPLPPTSRPPTSRRQFLHALGLAGVIGAGGLSLDGWGAKIASAEPTAMEAPVKTRATYFTAEKVEAARRNIAQFPWAEQISANAAALADRFLALGDDALWSLISSQGVPRSYAVNQDLGSPITGTDIYEYGAYPFRADPIERPWKLVDPSSDYVFPTNDFASYYASGLDDHGNFSRELADPQFLVNELYPDRGPDWGVDDGFGWIDDDGHKWTFVAYYAHWFVWYTPAGQFSVLGNGLKALRDAYMYTGDPRYAHGGLVLLDRVADLYPSMDTAPYKRADGYFHSDGLRGTGKVIGGIWETGLARGMIEAYDAFYPAIADADTADVITFLTAKSTQYGLAPKATTANIRSNIENGILRQVFPAVKTTQIFGNFGMHQSTLAMAAVVLDEETAAKEWLDFVFAAGGILTNPYRCTGGNVGPQLINVIDRDGWLNEGAPGYNRLAVNHIKNIADITDGYDLYPGADTYANAKFKAMTTVRGTLTMLNKYTPSIGDSGTTGGPYVMNVATDYVAAFDKFRSPVDAQLAYLLNNNSVDGLYTDIFSLDIPGTQAAIQSVIDEQGELDLESDNQTGFGFAAFRTGAGDHRRGAWLYYGTSKLHGHNDTLVIDAYDFGMDVASPLGYPSYADNKALRAEWESTTVASNTVVVDAKPQADQLIGHPLDFGDHAGVRLVDVEAPDVYSQTSRFRRTLTMIDIDDQHSYYVDLFRVRGGSDHLYSFHATAPAVTTTGLELVAQPTGNYAGSDVPTPDPLGSPRPGANGFDYLTKVERDAQVDGQFSVDWAIPDNWNVHQSDPNAHLRLTMLSGVDEVALADGIPPQNKPGNPKSLRYLLARRKGSNLSSQFVSVIEPYLDQPTVTSCVTVAVKSLGAAIRADEVAAVKITLADGRVDYVVHSTRPDVPILVDKLIMMRGRHAVLRIRDGRPVAAVGSDLVKLTWREDESSLPVTGPLITGKITAFTQELSTTNKLTIALDASWADLKTDIASLTGRFVYAEDDGVRNAVYAITEATVDGKVLTLTTDTTFIRGFADDNDADAGYLYDVAVGRKIKIPQIRSWQA